MSEDKSQKTEKATPKKLRDARKKGQVAQSREIVSTSLLLSILLFVGFFWQRELDFFKQLILLPADYYSMPFDEALSNLVNALFYIFIYIVAPFVGIAIVIIIISSVLQFGFIFAVEPLKPDFNKINPITGFKKIFAVKNLIDVGKSIVKLILLSVLLYYVIRSGISDMVHVAYYDITVTLGVLANLMTKLLLYLTPALIGIAVVDYFIQKAQFLKEQMMSKQEVKRQHREMEGDPQIKSRRKQQHREMATEDIGHRVRTSTLILVDGSKLAIALWYDKNETPLPMIMAIAKDESAKQIVKFAHASDKPIIEEPGLARTLLEKSRTDQYIPPETIDEVAAVMRKVSMS